ncbi:DEAD/DEAH box helicase [Amycolatopsis rhizosphaerae]|uniref:DEAD/DEAH box helicase n=1 Tax=Amycolatopsis rhizosphaerae TaxID=2053003 RepID=A0A558D2R4_9PSEU|nr:DEAD/DEAH box helicase [Amycolatopsis rhizosphaerae]TVT55315.1 DEAD/DEAH box helicase [Amycolatopsis rhizosphaerae]
MDAFGVLGDVLDDYESFVRGFLNIHDPDIREKVEREVENGLLWPEPWLALNPAFQPGGSVSDLVGPGQLHPACREIFRHRNEEDPLGRELAFHRHQADAIRVASRRESYVLTTGTGSGKSLSYIVPIVDRVLREGSGRGVRAIVVYPMNALANSQRGELEKFLGKTQPRVSFARYTGQEKRAERDAILANPPDILLTNYMMLELMLTRPREREGLIASAENLSFLVLDELHTYRGRQGADVAMLVRRLRSAVRVDQLQCIGTSATLAGPGSRAEQRAEVARLATRLFGTEIPAGNVIGESLERATIGTTDNARLAARVTAVPPTTHDGLRRDALAIWIEQTFGLREDDEGNLARQAPTRLREAAKRLEELTGIEQAICAKALRDTLLAGSRVRDETGRTLFAFKLHQFIGKGDTAYVTLAQPGERYLTTRYQRSAPIDPPGQPLFPLAFCRECGQDFLVVKREQGGEKFSPRTLNGGIGEPAEASGLLIVLDVDWPDMSSPALLGLVPDDWVIESGNSRELDRARRTRLPQPFRVDPFGTVTDEGVPVAFFETLHFCPSCKTSYESTGQSEFSRVASLGTEGRASAVSVLSQAVVRTLREASDLDNDARKFLVFSDNRQDASLQAGHFNDFVLVGLIRSALYRAVVHQRERYPDEPLTDEDLGSRVIEALNLKIADFAKNPEVEYGAEQKVIKALRESVSYRVWADLRRGWRITMPNLEQTGQLRLDYASLDRLAADDAKWVEAGEPLAGAEPETRRLIMQALLDEMRRNICIESEYLTEERYEAIRRASQEWLRAPWALTDEQGVYAATCYPGPRPKALSGVGRDLYLSGLGLYGRWLRRPNRFPLHPSQLKVADADAVIATLLKTMAKVGLLTKIEERHRRVGYRIQAGMIEWRAGDGQHRAPDPMRGHAAEGRVNPYFRRFYAETAGGLAGLEAREHTAQVAPEKRQERERLFSNAALPVLYCSPTMELGVDIKSLNVVGMRNVPPTPANYAQRSGRAGRSGQPAVVLTYCATGNAHDNYYFQRSQDMVAGAVAPPRLELGNQDLVRAHAHALWLVETGLDLGPSMVELLDVDLPGQPLREEVISKISSNPAASRAAAAVRTVLLATSEVTSALWWREGWIGETVSGAPTRFQRALDRWRGLYQEALQELDGANTVLKTIGASEPAKRRARGQIAEARAALDLLRGEVDDVNQGDFYPYRYFASEGFLPGYSFPRLPLAAFIPAERRTRNGQGDYVQRPRFLAISEFGPGAFIYHEGARYEVNRVSLPAREDGTGVHLTEIQRCNACGYLNDGNGPTGHGKCEHCDSTDLLTMTSLMRLLAVKTRRRDRISADEEERQRAGHEITTAIRFEPHGERSSKQTSTLLGAEGEVLAELSYGDTALIRRMNVGLRRRKDKNDLGYLLDTVEGKWARTADAPPGEVPDDRIQRVVPYVQDHRNALLIKLASHVPIDQRMAAMYALKRAVETEFQLESDELAVEPMPGRGRDHNDPHAWSVLLMYEAAEGGAGVLRRLAIEDGPMRRVARRAIALLHYDPDTGEDLGKAEYATEPCAQACYDCLLSYGNQWDHQALDRHCVIGLLQQLSESTLQVGGAGEDRSELLARLTRSSNELEQRFLRLLDEHGYRLPDEAQQTVEGFYVRPDFTYHTDGVDVAIFIDGPVHDHDHQTDKDRAAQARLEDEAGWLVLRFHHEDGRSPQCGDQPRWRDIVQSHPSVFGMGRAGS